MHGRIVTWVLTVLIGGLLVAHPAAAQPDGYYDAVNTTNAQTLRATLHDVIDDHTRFPYTSSSTDTWDILKLAEQDPADSGRILIAEWKANRWWGNRPEDLSRGESDQQQRRSPRLSYLTENVVFEKDRAEEDTRWHDDARNRRSQSQPTSRAD